MNLQCIGDIIVHYGQGGNMSTNFIVDGTDKNEIKMIRNCLIIQDDKTYELLSEELSKKFKKLYNYKHKVYEDEGYETFSYVSCSLSKPYVSIIHNHYKIWFYIDEYGEKCLNKEIHHDQDVYLYLLEDILKV